MTPLAASTSFDVPLLVFGAVLMGGALLSGLAHRSFLSLTALFVLTGFCSARAASASCTSTRDRGSSPSWRPSRWS